MSTTTAWVLVCIFVIAFAAMTWRYRRSVGLRYALGMTAAFTTGVAIYLAMR